MLLIKNKSLFITALILFVSLSFTLAKFSHAQNSGDEVLEAKVTEIIRQRELISNDGVKFKQQDLRLLVTKGSLKGKTIVYHGISDIEVANQNTYQVGDKVLVMKTTDENGQAKYYVTDYVRRGALTLLAVLFVLSVLLVAGGKGLRAVIILIATFFIIIKFIIPQILNGANPLLISVISSLVIAALAIFGTDGFNKKSRIAYATITISLFLTVILSYVFVHLARLTGASEEAAFILNLGRQHIDVRGLLLAGIILGSLGVLDDVIISQVSSVKEITEANPELSAKQIRQKAMRIGTDHINAMINTLFLAYAGAALPLLMLFSLKIPPFVTFSQTINHELIANEIVRTMVGSIALILAVPIATWLAVLYFKKRKEN